MKIDPKTISRAVNVSIGKFDHLRKARGRFMQAASGRFFSKSSARLIGEDLKASPINLMYSAVGTLVPNLVYNDPKVQVTTQVLAYSDYASLLATATDDLSTRIDLRMTLRKAIYDAVFMAGFIKTGIAASDQFLTLDGVTMALGQPYAERIDPDDIIPDPSARDWRAQAFTGNKYRKALSALEAEGILDMDDLRRISKAHDQRNAADLMGTSEFDRKYDDVEEYVDLVDVYFPAEGIVVTLPYEKDALQDKFLNIADYAGPDTGPYHMLGFTPVSDNLMPVAPAGIWYDLHTLGNRIARKLARQAEREKSVLAYDHDAAEDAEKLADASDGESIAVDDVNKIKEVKYGGATPEAYQWMDWVKHQFSEQSGNSDLLSGVSTNSPTATQAEMLQANTSVRLADMQNIVYNFTAEVTRDLGFFLHTDPLIDLPLIQRVNGVQTQVHYTPEMRRGEFFHYVFKIKPFSMARPDPNMAVRRKLEFATNVIPAAANAAMMLGPGFKIGPFLRQMAQEVNLEGADEWLDDAAFQQHIMQQIQAAMMTGSPGKATQNAPTPPSPFQPPAFNPGQPNPSAMGPTGGISPNTEQAMAQQETAGEIQGLRQPSARAIALSR
jgi:hypothetical protein